MNTEEIEVAAYYFPGWHADPVNEESHGRGWTEWDLLRRAESRFQGHIPPTLPAWGEFDEADPSWMLRQIDLAISHGVTAFLFDWYWYRRRPFLERPLQTFMKLVGGMPMRFALMWANHGWSNVHPASSTSSSSEPLLDGRVDGVQFDEMTDRIVGEFFSHQGYLQHGGVPYFSIYDPATFVAGIGSVEAASDALTGLREKSEAAGHEGVHLNCVLRGPGNDALLPSEFGSLATEDLLRMGFDSATSYSWVHYSSVHDSFPTIPYDDVRHKYEAVRETRRGLGIDYLPHVSIGWDSTPRCVQSDRFERRRYPWLSVWDERSPAALTDALASAKAYALAGSRHPMVTINAWNEWTEGSCLLPDRVVGTAYLEAVRSVFGVREVGTYTHPT